MARPKKVSSQMNQDQIQENGNQMKETVTLPKPSLEEPMKSVIRIPAQAVPAQAVPASGQSDTPLSPQVGRVENQLLNIQTVKYMIYLMYKSNLLARNNLKELLKVISEPAPDDISAYIVKESYR